MRCKACFTARRTVGRWPVGMVGTAELPMFVASGSDAYNELLESDREFKRQ